jgi:hypothetical protein
MNTNVLEAAVSEPPGVRCDSAPSEYLELQLQRRLGSRVRNLRVLVKHDGVILQGRTSTYHAKQLAQHAAMELGDVRILSNEIEVA